MGACLRRKQRLYSDCRNFFVLRPLVLRVVSFERVYSALSDDVWYCSVWYWKFLRNIDLKSRHANVFRVCGSLRQLCNVCVYGGGSLRQLCNVCVYGGGSLRQLCNVCVYGAKIFPVCLAFQGRKISSILSSCSFWRKNHTNQREVWFSKNILAVETFPPNCLHMCIFWGWKDRYTLHVNGSKQCGPGGLWLWEEMGLDRVNVDTCKCILHLLPFTIFAVQALLIFELKSNMSYIFLFWGENILKFCSHSLEFNIFICSITDSNYINI